MLNSRRRRRSSRGEDGEDDKSTSGSKCWAAVQEYMQTYDEKMIDDFMDDIDTLLVFAGLLSAIITAFVAVSYTFLQQDNTQLTVQLLSVLVIQSGGLSGSEAFLNSTASALPSSTAFQAPSSAVNINILWFTSLILSLVAALYGILAKQWCREYRKWNVIRASARENVLVRHARFEAWEQWKVPTFIDTIPTLLEFALVLFLSGMIILLWTLQNTVASIMSGIIGAFLLFALIITVLPIFSTHCPYKSTTGRILAELCIYYICSTVVRFPCPARVRRSLIRWTIYNSSEPLRDWRRRELYTLDNPVPPPLDKSLKSNWWAREWDDTCRDSIHVGILLRALSWVQQGSSETFLTDGVSKCIRSLHRNWENENASTVKVCSSIRALRTLSGAAARLPSSEVTGSTASACKPLRGPQGLAYEVGSYNLQVVVRSWLPGYEFGHLRIDDPMAGIDKPLVHPLLARLIIIQDLGDLVDVWIARDIKYPFSVGDQDLTKTMVLMLCFLRHYGMEGKKATRDVVDTLTAVYTKLRPITAACETGLVSMVAHILCVTGDVTLDARSHAISVRIQQGQVADSGCIHRFASFAQQVYDQNRNYSRANARHLFVMAVHGFLQQIEAIQYDPRAMLEHRDTMRGVFTRMAGALKLSLDNSYMNCGGYVDLPWAAPLATILNASVDLYEFIRVTEFVSLLPLLQENLSRGFISGTRVQEQSYELVQLASNTSAMMVSPEWGREARDFTRTQQMTTPTIPQESYREPEPRNFVQDPGLDRHDFFQTVESMPAPYSDYQEPFRSVPFSMHPSTPSREAGPSTRFYPDESSTRRDGVSSPSRPAPIVSSTSDHDRSAPRVVVSPPSHSALIVRSASGRNRSRSFRGTSP